MVHPGIRFGRRVEVLTAELNCVREQHQQALLRILDLEKISAKLSADLEIADQRREEEVHMTQGDFEASMCRAREREDFLVALHEDQMRQAEVRFEVSMSEVQASHEAELTQTRTAHAAEVQAWRANLQEARKQHSEAVRRLHVEIEELEQQVDILQEALKPGGASGKARPTRVVPRSRGVLCAGCLTQILHRDVRQLKPSEALQERTDQQLAREKTEFFTGVVGAPDEHDPAHSWLYHRHKDPHGLVHELRQIASEPNLDAAAASQPTPGSEVADPHGERCAVTAADVTSTECKRPRSASVARVPPLLRKGKESEALRPQSAATTLGAARRRPRSGARSRSEALRQEVAGSRANWQAVWT